MKLEDESSLQSLTLESDKSRSPRNVPESMEATQFLVQWEEHPSHLATRLGYLLEHQSLVDVTLMCNTHTLKVHRAVLAACSPYFERQLGNHPLIVLKDMKFSVLKSLVEFMYCGETSVSEENLTPLLEAAKFFEVKGLSAMTKESVCTPSTPLGLKTFNGTSVTAPSGSLMGGTIRSTIGLGGASSSGIGRGRGRGRGRPPLNPTAKVGSPTESAQILLSLSNTTTNDPLAPVSSSSLPQSTVHQNQQHSLYKHPLSQLPNKTASSTPGENKLGPSKFGPYEPRRRGRKRGAVNSAFRDRLLREQDTHMVLENFKRDLTDDSESSSPLLSSLLTGKPPSSVGVGPDKTPGSSTSGPSDYVATKLLKEIGLPSNVPLLMDNGDGKLVTLTEEVLKSVGFDPEGQIHVQGPSLSDVKYKKTNNIVTTSKPLNHQLSLGGRINDVVDGCRPDLSKVKKELLENDTNDEELIQKLRSGAACEAQNDPDAVVLYEVTNDKNVQKFVLSAKEVESLKMLNAQLDKHKKELRDLQRQQESHMQQDDSGCVADGNGGEDKCDSLGSTTGTDSPSSRIAILKMKINEVKALLQQMMNIAQGIKPRNCFTPKQEAFHTATDSEMLDVGDSVDLQMNKTRIVYEFVDNNGEKIDGYQPRGNVPDKKENKDEFMGLFEMVCDSGENPGEEDVSPLLSESGRVVRGNSTEPSPRRDHHSSTTFHVLEDDDVHDGGGETISYEIDGMMNDEGHNIVIEGGGDTEVGGDVKDTEEDGTSSDFKYIMNVVYDSDHVIYDTAALPSATQEEDTAEYIVYSEEDASRHHHVDDSHHPDDGVGKSDVITGVQHSEMMSGVDFVELDDDRTDETHLIHRENSPPVKKPRLQVDPL